MTKEMRPNHRVDVLSDALLFYGKKKCASIGKPKNYFLLTYSIFDH